MRLLAARTVGLPRGDVEVKANAHHERLAAEGGLAGHVGPRIALVADY